MDVSIVLPLYGNAETAEPLVEGLARHLAPGTFELVAVDDAGPDDSAERVRAAAARFGIPCIVLSHEHNRGQNQALLTGLARARGTVTVVMDADLQEPPAVAHSLVQAVRRSGADVAFGHRRGYLGRPSQVFTSYAFKRLLFLLLRSPLPARVGLFAALSTRARQRVLDIHAEPPYLLAMIVSLHLPTVLVPYERRPRPVGTGRYSFRARCRLAWRGLRFAWRCRRGLVPEA